MTHAQEKTQATKITCEEPDVGFNKVFKAVIINVFKELEETMLKEVNRD